VRTHRFALGPPAATLSSLLVAALLAPSPVLGAAHDGRFAIDAACVLDGCFPGDSPGFPVEITAAGSYVLTSDLSVAGQSQPELRTAITVSAAAVDLDLAGFALRGPTSCSGDPLSCAPTSSQGIGVDGQAAAHGLRIHDGTITGFGGDGLAIHGDMATLDRLRVNDNGGHGIAVSGLAARLSELVVNENGDVGVYLPGAAASIRDSSVSQSLGGGIHSAAASLVDSNTVTMSGIAAATISSGLGSRGANNLVEGGLYGIATGSGALIYGNRIDWSSQYQLFLAPGAAYTANHMWTPYSTYVVFGLSLTQNLCNTSPC